MLGMGMRRNGIATLWCPIRASLFPTGSDFMRFQRANGDDPFKSGRGAPPLASWHWPHWVGLGCGARNGPHILALNPVHRQSPKWTRKKNDLNGIRSKVRTLQQILQQVSIAPKSHRASPPVSAAIQTNHWQGLPASPTFHALTPRKRMPPFNGRTTRIRARALLWKKRSRLHHQRGILRNWTGIPAKACPRSKRKWKSSGSEVRCGEGWDIGARAC